MDGGLRSYFQKNLRSAQWTPVETGLTQQGVPDSEYCFPAVGDPGSALYEPSAQGWVEHKRTEGWAIHKSKSWPFQVAWISRRVRMGGRAFVAVRRKSDELWIVHGREIKILAQSGLRSVNPLGMWSGGPNQWDWERVERILRGEP